ncbi:MAG: hypothetical protein ABIP48_10385 [Planctomycetota bacterium]
MAALLSCSVLLAGAVGQEPAPGGDPAPGGKPEAVEQAAPPELSPEMAALRDSLRQALARVAKQPPNTRDNTPGEMISFCLAFGCDANVGNGSPSGQKISGIGCLCWNYPCAGYRLLRTSGDRVLARVGYGLQSRPTEFLAVLAQSRASVEYEVRVGDVQGTVADLVEFEKLNCRGQTDLSGALVGLAHYVEDDEPWTNDLGEEWSFERLVREELDRSPRLSASDATDRLMGLSYAVDRQTKRELPLEGAFLRAEEYLGKFQDHAFELQNPDGTWHPNFFARKGTSSDATATLRSTGHILEWLVFSLPGDRLEDPRVIRSVAYVAKVFASQRSGWSVVSMSARDIGGVMHAAHALSIYDRRVFRSPVPAEPEGPTKQARRIDPEKGTEKIEGPRLTF